MGQRFKIQADIPSGTPAGSYDGNLKFVVRTVAAQSEDEAFLVLANISLRAEVPVSSSNIHLSKELGTLLPVVAPKERDL